jgi:hypothetical protein
MVCIMNCKSQDTLVNIVTGHRLDGQGLIPGKDKSFFCTPQRPDQLLDPHSLLSSGHWGALSLGAQQLGHEADHLPPSIAEVMNGRAMPSLSSISSSHSA